MNDFDLISYALAEELQGALTSMKRYIPLVIALSSLLSVAALAQTPTPPRGAATPPPATAPTGGTGAEGKIGLIFAEAFPGGILELKARFDALKVEMEPYYKDYQSLTEQLDKVKNQLKASQTLSAATIAQLNEQGADLERKIKRKEEDIQALEQKRANEVIGPIQEKIGNALKDYSAKRGIALILEAGVAQKAGLLLWASEATNITQDFISEYNKANPVVATTSTAPPKKDK